MAKAALDRELEAMHDKKEESILQLVGFHLGEEEYGVEILKVQEINRMLQITKVPKSPEFVEGIINLRGKVIPVINLRKRFGMNTKDFDKQTRIVVVDIDKKIIGLVVDSVSEVIRLNDDTVEPPPPIVSGDGADYINGVGKISDRLLMLLDLDKLFTIQEKKMLDKMAQAA